LKEEKHQQAHVCSELVQQRTSKTEKKQEQVVQNITKNAFTKPGNNAPFTIVIKYL
jgi:Txe/YoeB family toxin of Txe-Axe toxin-antitoxin module